MATLERSTSTAEGDPSASTNGLTTLFLGVAAVTTLVGFAALFATWYKAAIDPGKDTILIAQKQYALNHFLVAADLAEQAELDRESDEDLELLREYIIGAGRVQEVLLSEDPKRRRSELFVSIPHLKNAAKKWPLGREDEGDRLLGLSLYYTGDYAGAIAPLSRCIDRNPTMHEELIPIYAKCHLYGERPSAADALRRLDQLELETLRPASLRLEVESLRAQCLLRLGQYQAARELLASIEQRYKDQRNQPENSKLLLEQIKLHWSAADVSEAIERFGKGSALDITPNEAAIQFLAPTMTRLSLLRRDAPPEISNQAALWTARALACCGQPKEALSLWTLVRQQQPFDGSNIAAGIEEIESLAETGSGEEALQSVRYLLREIGNEQNYDGSVVDLANFRTRFIAALQQLRRRDRYDECVAIARVMPTLFPEAEAYQEEAITHQQAAEKLMSVTRSDSDELPSAEFVEAKVRYRQAGDAFLQAARLRFDTRAYCDTLWQAIECYQACGQFERCAELLDDYLRYEDRRRQPRAWLALGKSRLAAGEPQSALVALETCIAEYPRDPLGYDARLTAALAHAEQREFDKAKALLDQNLIDGALTPESNVWRDSLFTLGEILFRQAYEVHMTWDLEKQSDSQAEVPSIEPLREHQPLVEEAVLKLGEAATRYWPNSRAKHAAYLHARAHQMAAVWPTQAANAAGAIDAARRQLRQRAEQHLTAALTGYLSLRRDLSTREEEQPLSESQAAMLRNCFMGEADALMALQRYEEAADAYRAVSLRYMNEPPALEAMLGQANCLKQLSRNREARLVIRQASVVLSRIPPEQDAEFLKTSRYDRRRWQELLAWLDTGPIPDESDT